MNLKAALLFFTTLHLASAMSTQEVLKSPNLNPKTRIELTALLARQEIQSWEQWSLSASEELLQGALLSEQQLLDLRANSEMTPDEIANELSISKARSARPSRTRLGSLYVDFYQESPVLIDYKGEGNEVVAMSFGVVYKYVSGANGKVVPHFVRAQLVSPGAAGHRSSVGEFNIDRRHRYYVSQTYGSRMDYAQFFIGGIALHETPSENYRKLGMPASHGCIRHHVKDADAMWNLIGDAREDGDTVNIKVYPFGAPVVLADGALGTETAGMGEKLNTWLNNSIDCARRGVSSACSLSWEEWD